MAAAAAVVIVAVGIIVHVEESAWAASGVIRGGRVPGVQGLSQTVPGGRAGWDIGPCFRPWFVVSVRGLFVGRDCPWFVCWGCLSVVCMLGVTVSGLYVGHDCPWFVC